MSRRIQIILDEDADNFSLKFDNMADLAEVVAIINHQKNHNWKILPAPAKKKKQPWGISRKK